MAKCVPDVPMECVEWQCTTEKKRNTTQEDRKPVCSHIKTMCKEIQYLESIFPEYFQESAQAEGDVQEHNFQFPVNPEMEVNNEDRNIVQNIPGHFNIDTGLWEYESLSKHMSRYSTSSSVSIFTFDCKSLSLVFCALGSADVKRVLSKLFFEPQQCLLTLEARLIP